MNSEESHTDKSLISNIYLYCYDIPFQVFAKAKHGAYSNHLDDNQINTITNLFNEKNIPYKTNLDINLPTMQEAVRQRLYNPSEKEICSSRVVIIVEGQEYTIYNYPVRLINKNDAKKIYRAFERKGIMCRVEDNNWGASKTQQNADYNAHVTQVPNTEKTQKNVVRKESPKMNVTKYEQTDLFSQIVKQQLEELSA